MTNPMSEDTARLVYRHLRQAPHTVTELSEATGISGSAIQATLQLNLAHLIKRERVGRVFIYSPRNKSKAFSLPPVESAPAINGTNSSSLSVESTLIMPDEATSTPSSMWAGDTVVDGVRALQDRVTELEMENAELRDEVTKLEGQLAQVRDVLFA